MIRQSQRLDTIKLYVHLISKIKKGEEIDLSNRLLSTQFKKISNKQIKLMLQIQSLNYENITEEEIKDYTKNIVQIKEKAKVGSQDYKILSLLTLKLHSVPIVKALNARQTVNFIAVLEKFISQITTLEEYRYILQTIFHFKSVVALQKADLTKIQQKYNNRKQLSHLLFFIALVKATISPQESSSILKKLNYGPNILQQRKQIIMFLSELAKKQRQLSINKNQESNLERSYWQADIGNKKVIKNSIQSECKIQIHEESQEQTLKKVNSSLDQNIYLYACPLVHFYFQKNPQVAQSLKPTELYKSLITSKSILVQNPSKGKFKPKKNPESFPAYYQASLSANLNTCSLVCKQGLMFTKHNYGNLSSSNKFVKVTPQAIEYYKSSQESSFNNRWQMKEVMGIVYGKITARQLENQSAEPQCCFSFILVDRTFDLSVQSKDRIPEMHQFMRGASALISKHHQQQKKKVQQKLSTENKKKKVQELNEKISLHDGKIQKITKGRLLWSQLILSLNKKVSFNPQTGKTYLKLQGIKRIGDKIQKR